VCGENKKIQKKRGFPFFWIRATLKRNAIARVAHHVERVVNFVRMKTRVTHHEKRRPPMMTHAVVILPTLCLCCANLRHERSFSECGDFAQYARNHARFAKFHVIVRAMRKTLKEKLSLGVHLVDVEFIYIMEIQKKGKSRVFFFESRTPKYSIMELGFILNELIRLIMSLPDAPFFAHESAFCTHGELCQSLSDEDIRMFVARKSSELPDEHMMGAHARVTILYECALACANIILGCHIVADIYVPTAQTRSWIANYYAFAEELSANIAYCPYIARVMNVIRCAAQKISLVERASDDVPMDLSGVTPDVTSDVDVISAEISRVHI